MLIKSKLITLLVLLWIGNSAAQSNIGEWSTDAVGLPVYHYTGKIPYIAVASDNQLITYPQDPWFLLGNYAITNFVHTTGEYDMYTLHRAWGRLNVASETEPSSSAQLTVNGETYKITGLNSSIACNAEKVFGTGFAQFDMKVNKDLTCERTIAIPPSKIINQGIGASLITILLTNTGTTTQNISYKESVLANYEMLNENRINYIAVPQSNSQKASSTFKTYTDKTITKVSRTEESSYDFYPATLFIKADKKASYSYKMIGDSITILSATKTISLKPGKSKTISFAVGFVNEGVDIEDMIEPLFSKKAKQDYQFRSDWKAKLPNYSWQKDEIIRREQYWNTYVLEASAKYNEYFDETFIPQGMTYDYGWGLNAVARDHLHYSLSANYFNPPLAKSILRFVLKEMNPNGYYHYNVNGYGYAVPNLWNPSDLQLHLFWATAEYLEKSNDYSFLLEKTPYYPKKINYSGTVIEKLKVAFDYLNDEISVGPHGLVKMLNADWNDQIWNEQPITIHYSTAESHYDASMAIVVLEKLSTQLKKASEVPSLSIYKKEIVALQKRIELYQKQQLKAFLSDLGDRDFVKRAYYNDTLSMGADHMHIESQLYTLMIDDIPLSQRQKIMTEANKRLANNEVLGLRTSETKVSDTFEAGTHENGGIWQYVQGMYSLGLLHVDIAQADKAIKRMSFDNFASNFPDYWPGQWTGADCVSSSLAKYPGLVSNNGSGYMNFPTYCAHIHSWPLLYQFKRREMVSE